MCGGAGVSIFDFFIFYFMSGTRDFFSPSPDFPKIFYSQGSLDDECLLTCRRNKRTKTRMTRRRMKEQTRTNLKEKDIFIRIMTREVFMGQNNKSLTSRAQTFL
jgi:hypothetical protein